MLRTRLLTATAAIALFGAGSVFAQDAQAPASAPGTAPQAVAPAQAATPSAANTVVDVLRTNGQFSTLLSALDAAQLTETLQSQPAISIFAPTDAAFAALPEAERTRLLDPANVNDLRQLLLYHVIVADVNSSQIEGTKGGVETAARTQVELDGTGSSIMIDEATVTTADLDASNGAVFVIDRVLSPATSQVAVGDAVEGETTQTVPPTAPTSPAMPTSPSTPPSQQPMNDAAPPAGDATTPPPTDGSMMGDDMDNDSATTTGETAPTPDDMTTPPAGSTSVSPTPGAPTAPNGQPATSTTTTASPPVANPTDGQTDDEADDMAPTPQA